MGKWRKVRCVVEYRTNNDIVTESLLANHVQNLIEQSPRTGWLESKMWAFGFDRTISNMKSVRPAKLRSVTRSLEAAIKRLKKL